MAPSNTSSNNDNNNKPKKKNPLQHLIAGGAAGLVESSCCHPLDTIKTRMQLRRQAATIEAVKARSSLLEPGRLSSWNEPKNLPTRELHPVVRGVASSGGGVHEPALHLHSSSAAMTVEAAVVAPPPPEQKVIVKPTPPRGTVTAPLGPIGTARRIIQREGFFSLYKGLTAVYTGIIPKMAIRFLSFEQYREHLHSLQGYSMKEGFAPSTTFLAGLASGLTEAVLVVTPAEVCKIRMQSQYHSLLDPQQMKHRKYTNVVQTAVTIVREEGIGALYKGVVPTMMRQGCNQAVNFSVYNAAKRKLLEYKGQGELEHWESLVLGGVSGGMGPLVNNPLDVVKTRLQKQVVTPGKPAKYTGLMQSCALIAKEEGYAALWKGITPRLLRIMPGQAITFMTYEAVSSRMTKWGVF
uniref:Mitochondrial carrier protein n=1 Tax=Helicotheca tamesis TaxID=374047 RepID=A0A7S2HH19_9STRA|mmetsp:Transcript_18045/g.24843  ORF Transcript_18045/g.24843 Transcript_18045/m.24843 type:complete len:409 (+) Transcript_18045:63-1289(+)